MTKITCVKQRGALRVGWKVSCPASDACINMCLELDGIIAHDTDLWCLQRERYVACRMHKGLFKVKKING